MAAGLVTDPQLVHCATVDVKGGELDLAGDVIDLTDGAEVESAGVLLGQGRSKATSPTRGRLTRKAARFWLTAITRRRMA